MVAGNRQLGRQLGRWACWSAFVMAGLCAQARAAPAPPPPTVETLTDEHVVTAITRGIDFLLIDVDRKLEKIRAAPAAERGDPKHILGHPGELMFEAYALLHVGKDLKDKRIQANTDRVQLLKEVLLRYDSHTTYNTALQALALSQLPQTAEVRRALTRAATKIVNGRTEDGGYSYELNQPERVADQSNGQYAILGVWAAADAGVVIPGRYWTVMNEFWRATQLKDGGWAYNVPAPNARSGNGQSKPTMTVAGAASLFVCDEFINRGARAVVREDPAIDRALAATAAQLDLNSNDLYYLYGLERVALASGRKFFGNQDWYRPMAVNLLKRQSANGSFEGWFQEANPERLTCYAILLLARGRAPVLMNKLQYNGPWNLRPRDSANVHDYASKSLERIINWQTVPIDTNPEQWLDAPVLLITGSKDPEFTPQEVAKLKQFVRRGGMIFSMSDLNSEEFTAAARKYALQMYDVPNAPESLFRELPPDHPLFSSAGRMENPPKLHGVSNGLREMWVHCRTDFGAVWQSRVQTPKEAWELPIMLFTYAAGKEELRSRLQPLSVPAPARVPRRKMSVARLAFNGNWNPEPEAWLRLSRLMAHHGTADLHIREVLLKDLGAEASFPDMAHLAGTGKLVLTPEEQKALRDYVLAGGTVLVEALGGNPQFSASATEILKTLFPDSTLKLVPPEYFLFTGEFSSWAAKIKNVKYRRYWVLERGNQSAPRIEYLTVNKRVGVFFSGEDITSGLLGTDTWGIYGYTPESSVALAWNMVLYSARNAKARTKTDTQPAAATQSGPAAMGR